jgi:predicted RNA-binding protein
MRKKLEKTTRSYFVLIAADAHRANLTLPSALDLSKYRIKRREWGLKERTRYRRHMKPGDLVLIYLSGHREYSQHFIAQAEIVKAPSINQKGSIIDSPNILTSVCSEWVVEFKKINIFKNPVFMKDIIQKLEFIAPNRRDMWRIYFQGGAIKITEKDFDLITSIGK